MPIENFNFELASSKTWFRQLHLPGKNDPDTTISSTIEFTVQHDGPKNIIEIKTEELSILPPGNEKSYFWSWASCCNRQDYYKIDIDGLGVETQQCNSYVKQFYIDQEGIPTILSPAPAGPLPLLSLGLGKTNYTIHDYDVEKQSWFVLGTSRKRTQDIFVYTIDNFPDNQTITNYTNSLRSLGLPVNDFIKTLYHY